MDARDRVAGFLGVTTLIDIPVVSDAEVRRSLRTQSARLEAQLPPGRGRRSGGARLLSVEELERTRDDLVRLIQERRFTDGEEQDRKRILREKMVLEPAKYFG